MTTILHVPSSTRGSTSVTRVLAEELITALAADPVLITRDLSQPVPLLSPAVTAHLTTPLEQRPEDAAGTLLLADVLISELQSADIVVIGAPMYNFGVPASLKAWADLVGRAGTTFSYSEDGVTGLLTDRPVYVISASGGTEIGGTEDFCTPWLKVFLGFLGIHDVHTIAASGVNQGLDAAMADARTQLKQVFAA